MPPSQSTDTMEARAQAYWNSKPEGAEITAVEWMCGFATAEVARVREGQAESLRMIHNCSTLALVRGAVRELDRATKTHTARKASGRLKGGGG